MKLEINPLLFVCIPTHPYFKFRCVFLNGGRVSEAWERAYLIHNDGVYTWIDILNDLQALNCHGVIPNGTIEVLKSCIILFYLLTYVRVEEHQKLLPPLTLTRNTWTETCWLLMKESLMTTKNMQLYKLSTQGRYEKIIRRN